MKNCEFIVYAFKGKSRTITNVGSSQLIKVPKIIKGRTHPTEKPVALMSHLISNSVEKGKTVLDPFAGTGSTLVAAKLLGMNYVGYELDEEFSRIGNERLSSTAVQW